MYEDVAQENGATASTVNNKFECRQAYCAYRGLSAMLLLLFGFFSGRIFPELHDKEKMLR